MKNAVTGMVTVDPESLQRRARGFAGLFPQIHRFHFGEALRKIRQQPGDHFTLVAAGLHQVCHVDPAVLCIAGVAQSSSISRV